MESNMEKSTETEEKKQTGFALSATLGFVSILLVFAFVIWNKTIGIERDVQKLVEQGTKIEQLLDNMKHEMENIKKNLKPEQ